MMSTALRVASVVVCLAGFSGCIFATGTPEVPPPDTSYRALDIPENVLFNLVLAYDKKDLAGYSDLLAPDFHFHFSPDTPGDAVCETGIWDRDTDLALTGGLFVDPEVKGLHVNWVLGPAEPATEVGKEGMMRIRTTQAQIQVDTRLGAAYVDESELHQFYFRLDQDAEAGDRWQLVEWDVIPLLQGATAADFPTPVRRALFWQLKCNYAVS